MACRGLRGGRHGGCCPSACYHPRGAREPWPPAVDVATVRAVRGGGGPGARGGRLAAAGPGRRPVRLAAALGRGLGRGGGPGAPLGRGAAGPPAGDPGLAGRAGSRAGGRRPDGRAGAAGPPAAGRRDHRQPAGQHRDGLAGAPEPEPGAAGDRWAGADRRARSGGAGAPPGGPGRHPGRRPWPRPLAGPAERVVRVQTPDGPFALRLVARPLAAEAAEAARRRLRRAASKKGRTLDQRSLAAAGDVVLVTNLAPDAWTTAEVLALDRVRWQVELVFKQLKGIWRLDRLRARGAELAQVSLLGTLLAALLAERSIRPLPAVGGAWFDDVDRPLSLWRWQLLRHAALRDAVLAPLAPAAVLPALPALRRYLCDAPRRRAQQAAHVRRLLRDRCRDRPTPSVTARIAVVHA